MPEGSHCLYIVQNTKKACSLSWEGNSGGAGLGGHVFTGGYLQSVQGRPDSRWAI